VASDKDLRKEVRELNSRIAELERLIGQMTSPIRQLQDTASGYLRLAGLAIDKGRLSPEMLVPEAKDDISKCIVRVLMGKKGLNVSQVADAVKAERGTASRRIVRERLKELESKGVVERARQGARDVYSLSPDVTKKWSRMLGIDI